ncbi:MAG: hypothetical protein PHI52_02760 [Bacteroidales bacterium]|nr:hypothetical protein [Bacteroidales bacterium]
MKKISFVLFCSIVGISIYAQGIVNLIPSIEKKLLAYRVILYPLSEEKAPQDENKYIFAKYLNENFIYTITNNQKVSCSKKFKLPEDYRYLISFETENDIVGLYSCKKDHNYTYYINNFSKDHPEWDPQEFYSYNTNDNSYNYWCISSDNLKFAVFNIVYDKDDNIKSFNTTVFDQAGQKIWQNSISPDFSNKTINVHTFLLSNEGNVYLCISSYNENKKKTSNEKIHLIEVKENESNMYEGTEHIGYIKAASLKILKNGNVFIGGYYAKERDDECLGSFSLMYDTKAQTIENFSHKDFPEIMSKKDIESLSFNEIVELSNGNIALLGEQFKIQIYYQERLGNSYQYYLNNIIYTSISNDGTIEDYKLIRKKQNSGTYDSRIGIKSLYLSYYAFEKNGSLYLLYNDNAANVDMNKESVKPFYPRKVKSSIVKLVKIDGEDISSQVLINGKIDKQILRSFLFVNDNNIIVSSLGKELYFSKIPVNF